MKTKEQLTTNPAPESRKSSRRLSWRAEPRSRAPVLRFTPAAWAKLEFFRDRGQTEIGGFGIAAPGDLLRIEEFITVRQATTCVSVAFDDAAVADFFEAQVDAGRKPQQFSRIWLHSHPGDSPTPSGTDERTFADVFGRCDWAVMFVLAQGGETYARLRFSVGPGGDVLIPTEVDSTPPFAGSDHAAWTIEYERNIHPVADLDFGLKLQVDRPAGLGHDPDQHLLAALESDLGWGAELHEAEALVAAAESGVML